MQTVGGTKEFLTNTEIIKTLLTPNQIQLWIAKYETQVLPKMLEDQEQRCVIFLYGSSASLTRKLKIEDANDSDRPMDILHMDLNTARKKFPDKPEIQACCDDPNHQTYAVITATYLPLKMLGNEEDGMYPFAITTHQLPTK
jgi:hypothetical protein